MDNGKKEYAEDGWECDYTSQKARRIFIHKKGVSKYIKRKMNKRFRKRYKNMTKVMV